LRLFGEVLGKNNPYFVDEVFGKADTRVLGRIFGEFSVIFSAKNNHPFGKTLGKNNLYVLDKNYVLMFGRNFSKNCLQIFSKIVSTFFAIASTKS